MRTIAIGDIHGCSIALARLVERIAPLPGDTVVTLGDYIDRGPDSRNVIERLLALGRRCELIPLLGNHEEILLDLLSGKGDLEFWYSCGGYATVKSYGPNARAETLPAEHVAFLRSCVAYHETDTHLFTHANYHPDLPLCEHDPHTLRWESLQHRVSVPHSSGKTAIVGHTPQPGGQVLDLGYLKCIDTQCHGGYWLTALDVHTGHLWQANQFGHCLESTLEMKCEV